MLAICDYRLSKYHTAYREKIIFAAIYKYY